MDTITILILAVVIITIVVLVVYAYTRTTTTSALVAHSLTFEGKVLYQGANPAIYTSDGILFAKADGTYLYNTDTQKTTKLSSKVPVGLAYDGTYFMMLDKDQSLYHIETNSVTPMETGYSKLYDTVDGYFIGSPAGYTVTGESGSTTANTGNYGLIVLIAT
jgi:hypothetical protein